jgi:hypothetical protein
LYPGEDVGGSDIKRAGETPHQHHSCPILSTRGAAERLVAQENPPHADIIAHS